MKEIRICKFCGKEFEATNGMQKFCKGPHYDKCVICGKEFEVPTDKLSAKDRSKCCSKSCSIELRKQTNATKYGGNAPACLKSVRDKMQATNETKYGVKHAAQAQQFKDKSIATSLARYGETHYSKTEESRKQLSERFKDKKYVESVKQHRKETNIARYGVENTLQLESIRHKMRSTYKARTGYDQPFENPEVRAKIKATLFNHYGVEYPLQNINILNQSKQTNLDRYGVENPLQNEAIKQKVAATNYNKYGSTCYLSSEEGKAKTRSAMQKKYQCNYFSMSRDWAETQMTDSSKYESWAEFKCNPKNYILSHYKNKPSLRKLSIDLGVHVNTVGTYVANAGCQDCVAYVYSYMENEVYEFLKKVSPSATIERNTKKVITPYEIDIYLPEFKLGIECNPTCSHNSSVPFMESDVLSPSYHQMKTNLCDKVGVRLFHIFGYEWTYKRDIIESMLKNILKKSSNRIFARNTYVKEVSASDARTFLAENHRQGFSSSKVKLGLYTKSDDKLVSLMTFGRIRSTIGTGNANNSGWELVRFCNLLNANVIGGASKLFKHFIDTYHPKRIISFSDRAHTSGNLYTVLGFKELRRSDPGYVWVDTMNDKAYNRVNAQKSHIREFLHDDEIDLTKSERQIMIEHGFVLVFDSGTITWEWLSKL